MASHIRNIIRDVLAELLPHRKKGQIAQPVRPNVVRYYRDENGVWELLHPLDPMRWDDLFEGEALLEIEQ